MPNLIQPLSTVLNTIRLVNEGKESEALSYLGINNNSSFSNNSNITGSFLDRAIKLSYFLSEQVNNINDIHSGGLLVTPDAKTINSPSILSENMDLIYSLAESTSYIAANGTSAIYSLSEGYDSILTEDGADNIRNTVKEGLDLIKESVTNSFNSLFNMSKNEFKIIHESIESTKYINLINNALAGTNMLITVNKLKSFTNDNARIINESLNVNSIRSNSDDVLFGVLDLQESLINFNVDMNKFNNSLTTRLKNNDQFDNTNIKELSELMSGAIDRIAIPISEGKIELRTPELKDAFDNSIISIASLYDEYLQDFVRSWHTPHA